VNAAIQQKKIFWKGLVVSSAGRGFCYHRIGGCTAARFKSEIGNAKRS